jgi:hypothetical protein
MKRFIIVFLFSLFLFSLSACTAEHDYTLVPHTLGRLHFSYSEGTNATHICDGNWSNTAIHVEGHIPLHINTWYSFGEMVGFDLAETTIEGLSAFMDSSGFEFEEITVLGVPGYRYLSRTGSTVKRAGAAVFLGDWGVYLEIYVSSDYGERGLTAAKRLLDEILPTLSWTADSELGLTCEHDWESNIVGRFRLVAPSGRSGTRSSSQGGRIISERRHIRVGGVVSFDIIAVYAPEGIYDPNVFRNNDPNIFNDIDERDIKISAELESDSITIFGASGYRLSGTEDGLGATGVTATINGQNISLWIFFADSHGEEGWVKANLLLDKILPTLALVAE